MSDSEFDKDWKSNGRPQSTMAKSFSLALDDLFKIDSSVADLDAVVDQKKKVVSSQTTELEALEARLKATEERLKLAAQNTSKPPSGRSSPHPRPALGDTFTQSPRAQQPAASPGPFSVAKPTTGGNKGSPRLQKDSSYQAPPLPGALPPTPGTSEDGETSPAEPTAYVTN